ncbi:MAG: HAD hydrolase-like protein [Pseudomonadota bacterium]
MRSLIFDLDGTLWRGPDWYAEVLADLGVGAANKLRSRLADGANVIALARQAGIRRSHLVRACRERASSLSLYQGVADAIMEIAKRRIPTGIVTSLAGDVAAVALEHYDLVDLFPATEFAARNKATAIRSVLHRLGLSPGTQDFYIGDMPQDAAAAARAGVSFAWASWGYSAEPPAPCGAHLTRFEEVLDL